MRFVVTYSSERQWVTHETFWFTELLTELGWWKQESSGKKKNGRGWGLHWPPRLFPLLLYTHQEQARVPFTQQGKSGCQWVWSSLWCRSRFLSPFYFYSIPPSPCTRARSSASHTTLSHLLQIARLRPSASLGAQALYLSLRMRVVEKQRKAAAPIQAWEGRTAATPQSPGGLKVDVLERKARAESPRSEFESCLRIVQGYRTRTSWSMPRTLTLSKSPTFFRALADDNLHGMTLSPCRILKQNLIKALFSVICF